MLPEITPEESAAALDALVDDLLAMAELTQPPVDAFRVAATLDLDVAWDDGQAGRARLVALPARCSAPRTSILVKTDPRRERRQWAVAHEIGEATAHRVFAALGVDPREAPPAAREQIANCLAGRLLLPTAHLRAEGVACAWDIPLLKQRFVHASHELVARRLLELDVGVVIAVYDHNRLSWRRSNVPGRPPPLTVIERECQALVHRLGAAQRFEEGRRVVQGWPIHEEDWRREILRMEVDDWFNE